MQILPIIQSTTSKQTNEKSLFIVILICLLGYLFIGLFPQKAAASTQTLRVSPVIINIALSPGKTYSRDVTIENLSAVPMPLKASFNDFITSGEEGGYVFEDSKTNPLLSWSRLSENEFILSPKEKKKIQLTVTTPQTIPLGGYYGILFFEPVLQNIAPASTLVSSKVGMLMLANIGVPDPNAQKAEILTFSTPLVSEDGSMPLLLRVKNISLNFFTAKPIVKLTPLIDLNPELHSQKRILEDKIIFPGQVRRWTEKSQQQTLSPNIYKTQLAVSTGNGQYVTTEKYTIVFPFIQAFGVLAGIILIIFLIVKRKRLKEAVKAFLK